MEGDASKTGDAHMPCKVDSQSVSGIKVPGSGASHVTGQGILNSLLRHLLCGRCRLGGFARSFGSGLFQQTGFSKSIFPCPLPYPEVFRKCERQTRDLSLKRGMTSLIIVLNFLYCGKPRSAVGLVSKGQKPSSLQWKAIRRMERFFEAWLDVSLGPEEMGRAAEKVENIESILTSIESEARHLARSCQSYFGDSFKAQQTSLPQRNQGREVGVSFAEPSSTFKPIDASRLSFIGTPSFDPTPYLDPLGKKVFNDPMGMRDKPNSTTPKAPKLKVHCSRQERVKLYELLDASGRLSVHFPADVTPEYSSGLFSVTKDLSKDRLILDSRGANLLERPAGRWIRTLGSGEVLTRMIIPPDEIGLVSGNDLRDFYYLFMASESRRRRNILATPISPKEISHLHCMTPELRSVPSVYCSLASLAMGDTQAVELAQTCHVGLGVQCGVIDSENLICVQRALPRASTSVGVVIDDFITIQRLKASLVDKGRSPAALLADRMQEKYRSVNLIPHPKKAFRDETHCSFWGIDFDGVQGIIRGSLKRAVPLAGIILRLVKIGYATADLLQVISGALISLLLYRRRIMSLMDSLFDSFRNRDPRSIIELSGEVKGDLLTLVALMPVAGTNIRAPVSPRITATDASNWGEAGVVSPLPPEIAKEMIRHTLRKSVWVRLLSPGAALEKLHDVLDPSEELPDPDESFQGNILWRVFAQCLQYRLLFKQPKKGPRHINVGELRGCLKAERMHGYSSPGSRELYGVDSQVALGTLIKGRASSPALNAELVRSLPEMIANDMYFEGLYFESALNPGDDPTRGEDIRKANKEPPDWWDAASRGDFAPFDIWLEQHGLSPDKVAEIPPLGEVSGSCDKVHPFESPTNFSFQPPFVSQHDQRKTHDSKQAGPQPELQQKKGREKASCDDPPESFSNARRFPKLKPEAVNLLSSFAKDQFIGLTNWPPERPGYLDLFSGERGVAKSVSRTCDTWSLCFDIAHSPSEDLDREDIRQTLEKLIQLEAFIAVGLAPVCASFSTAITPPIRTREKPYGVGGLSPKMEAKVQLGNQSAVWCIAILTLCLSLKIPCWLENPSSSWFFRIPCWTDFVEKHPEFGFWLVDYCRFHKPWRKRTKFWSNTCLKGVRTLCAGCPSHQVLRGRSKHHRKNWTLVAQPYPTGICKAIACSIKLSLHKQTSENQKFDPAACAKAGFCCRIGEADHPGPRAPRAGLLEAVPLVELRTVQLQGKVWGDFVDWVKSELSEPAVHSALTQPLLIIALAKEYGNVLYSRGTALYVYRHFVVSLQKQVLPARPYISELWDMVSRWEAMEPTTHRTPLPAAIFRAMMNVALSWRWFRFAATLGIAFFGIGRPGEAITARRRNLILPSDMMAEERRVAYLQVNEPKARRRGKGKLQHMSLYDSDFIDFLERFAVHLDADNTIFHSSSSAFRRRWDRILLTIGVAPHIKLTPGGVRGGGCIHAFESGDSLMSLLWRMRLKHLQTLESYLQEVTAATVLPDLPPETRRNIRILSDVFPFVLRTALSEDG